LICFLFVFYFLFSFFFFLFSFFFFLFSFFFFLFLFLSSKLALFQIPFSLLYFSQGSLPSLLLKRPLFCLYIIHLFSRFLSLFTSFSFLKISSLPTFLLCRQPLLHNITTHKNVKNEQTKKNNLNDHYLHTDPTYPIPSF